MRPLNDIEHRVGWQQNLVSSLNNPFCSSSQHPRFSCPIQPAIYKLSILRASLIGNQASPNTQPPEEMEVSCSLVRSLPPPPLTLAVGWWWLATCEERNETPA